MTSSFDGNSQFSLVIRTCASNPPWNNLCSLTNIATELGHILIIYSLNLFNTKTTNLFATPSWFIQRHFSMLPPNKLIFPNLKRQIRIIGAYFLKTFYRLQITNRKTITIANPRIRFSCCRLQRNTLP